MIPFAQTRFNEVEGRFSPDGRWVAYVSNESGVNEVYVRAFNSNYERRHRRASVAAFWCRAAVVRRRGGARTAKNCSTSLPTTG